MKLRNISLTNFKRFKNISIELAPITLLTGPNSAGKSSLLYGLLGALQTNQFPFFYSPNGRYVNMGDFEEFTHNHTCSNKFSIQLDVFDSQSGNIKISSTFRSEKSFPSLEHMSWESKKFFCETRENKKQNRYFFKFEIKEYKGKEEFASFRRKLNELMREVMEGSSKKGTIEQMLADISHGKFYFNDWNNLHSKITRNQNAFFEFRDIMEFCPSFTSRFNYISAFRIPPERTYYQRAKADLKVDIYGENAIDQIFNWIESNSNNIQTINEALQSIGLASKISIKKHGAGRFDVRIKNNESSAEHSLPDVGFGVSQFLPILVADAQLRSEATLAISQPEIHLHPSAQASYASWISTRVTRDKMSYILETHSEYIINRLRLLIAKGELKESDVAVYYIDNQSTEHSPDSKTCHRLKLLKSGKIENAPKTFFDTYMMDTFDIAMSAQ